MIWSIFVVTCLIYGCMCKKYVLLPYDSELCKNYSQDIHKDYEFTVNQQINLNTDDNITDTISVMKSASLSRFQIDSDNYRYYLCRTLVKPMGRSWENRDVHGYYSFWNVRIRIDRILDVPNCNDYLLLQIRHKDNLVTTLEGHSDEVRNITYRDSLPTIVISSQRKLYITYFSPNGNSRCGYVINVTSGIYFKGDFSVSYQQDMCHRQDGFWCVNTSACIYRDMKCDGFDSCFDGGSDETECYVSGNFSLPTVRPKPPSALIDYLPWLAVGILPLILLLALICICSQHRSEVYFDEEEDNLEVDKSQDGDELWSSADGLEKIDDEEEEAEEGRDPEAQWVAKDQGVVVDDGGSMGLVLLPRRDAEMAPSRTLQSINRDYEDIDQPGDLPIVHNCQSSNVTHHCDRSGQNIMSVSQMTDDDYEDHLEDVGSLLRKVDKSKIPEEVRITANRPSTSSSPTITDMNHQAPPPPPSDTGVDYRSDYILV